MASNEKDISSTYWSNLFVPVIITLLIFISMFVFITTKIGQPHALINKIPMKSPNIMRGY